MDDLWLLSCQGNQVPSEKEVLKFISEWMVLASNYNVQ